IVERRAAESRFAAVGFVLADLISESRRAVEQALRVERRVVDLHIEIGEMKGQILGLLVEIHALPAEQLRLDRMKAGLRVRPGIDQLIELGNEAGGEDLGA